MPWYWELLCGLSGYVPLPHSLRIKAMCLILASVMGLCLLSGHVIRDVFSHMPQSTMSSAPLAARARPNLSHAPYGQGGQGAL